MNKQKKTTISDKTSVHGGGKGGNTIAFLNPQILISVQTKPMILEILSLDGNNHPIYYLQ